MNPVMQFLEDPRLNIKLAAEAITREQLIRELANSQDTVTLSDGRMLSHCSLTVCSSELTVFLGFKNLQLLSDLTDWYDCKRHWTYRTKNSGTDEVKGVWVNLLGATTPSLIRSSLPMDAVGGGLASRIVFVYAHRKQKTVVDPFMTKEEKSIRERLLNDLERIILLSGNFRMTPEFTSAWAEWYTVNDAQHPFNDAILSAYCERRQTLVIKLSMIVNVSRSDEMILSLEDFGRAVALLEEVEKDMPLALSGMGRGEHADVLSRLMEEIMYSKSCAMEDIMWKFRSDITMRELELHLVSLEAMGFCTYVVNTGKIVFNEGFDHRH
jgi:hypothetical protein